MRITDPLRAGRLLRRPNRFLAEVELDPAPGDPGDPLVIPCFVPNPGRMTELMVPGFPVMVAHRPAPNRRTAWDLVAVWYAGVWVGLDTRSPNALFAEAHANGVLPEFAGTTITQAEYTWTPSPWIPATAADHPATARHQHTSGSPRSRFDFLLDRSSKPVLVEVKSCNLVEDGLALFPDAPTTRGARHLRELRHAVAEGYETWVVFIVQRPDVQRFAPFVQRDPDFAAALVEAIAGGVRCLVAWCQTAPDGLTVAGCLSAMAVLAEPNGEPLQNAAKSLR